MPKHTMIAHFHDYGAAHRAFCELLQSGIAASDISLIAGDRSNQFGATRDFGVLAEDAEFYVPAVRRGTTLLAVRADARQGSLVVEIIQDHAPADLEEAEGTAAEETVGASPLHY